ncbi:hypothetical protein SARC_16240, partial [Sphaeroforma arctica JP610]
MTNSPFSISKFLKIAFAVIVVILVPTSSGDGMPMSCHTQSTINMATTSLIICDKLPIEAARTEGILA